MTEQLNNEPEHEENVAPAEAATTTRARSKALAWSVLGAMIVGFLVVDFFAGHLWGSGPEFEWITAILVGFCMGQLSLIAVWTSLAPGNIVVRISWSLLLTTATWYGLVLGRMTDRSRWYTLPREGAISLVVILLIAVAVLQIPLWIAKKLFRWRLTTSLDDNDAWLQEDRQFQVRHLLIAMFLVSVALSPLNQILPTETGNGRPLTRDDFIGLPIVLLCDLIVTLPFIWWAFVSAKRFSRLAFGWLAYCALLTAIEFACFYLAFGPPGEGESLKHAMLIYSSNLAQCAAVLGTLLVIRALGFRLIRVPAKT
jgi:hypothetical protein